MDCILITSLTSFNTQQGQQLAIYKCFLLPLFLEFSPLFSCTLVPSSQPSFPPLSQVVPGAVILSCHADHFVMNVLRYMCVCVCVFFAFILRLHLHNLSLEEETEAGHPPHGTIRYVSKFGFDTTTCCGMIPMPCDWCTDWVVSASRLPWL